MGILKVGAGAVKGVLEDTWREYFYCPSMEADVLVQKGEQRQSKRGLNLKKSENIISDGSIIAVNEGQAMIIVQQGEIVEFSAEACEFVFDNKTEPSIFVGSLKESVVASFKQFAKRVTFGGDTAADQRVYFFNTKEILGNKYGTANPVPFRVVDTNVGLDIDISIRCHGEYAYKIADPILFYKNICGNVSDTYNRGEIDSQLKSEMLTALQPAFAKISAMGIRYSMLPGHAMELSKALNEVLAENWGGRYGIEITSVGVNSVKASDEDEAMIKELQRNAALRNPNMAAAHLVSAQAEAMKAAAANENAGPMMAFAGMNMATQAGGVNASQLFQMAAQQPQQTTPVAEGWTCSCGATGNKGNFCVECGGKKPVDNFWTCSCGSQNKGKFCPECGAKKPQGVPQYKCDKCGWEPADPTKPPRFCPECGDPFGDEDII